MSCEQTECTMLFYYRSKRMIVKVDALQAQRKGTEERFDTNAPFSSAFEFFACCFDHETSASPYPEICTRPAKSFRLFIFPSINCRL